MIFMCLLMVEGGPLFMDLFYLFGARLINWDIVLSPAPVAILILFIFILFHFILLYLFILPNIFYIFM